MKWVFGLGSMIGEKKRVLVVDDERHIVRLIQVNLERQGYEVTCAFDGREAIERLEVRPFDLVILDLEMPGTAGCEVLRWIRAGEHRDTAVWLLASEEEAEAAGCGDARADRYSAKR